MSDLFAPPPAAARPSVFCLPWSSGASSMHVGSDRSGRSCGSCLVPSCFDCPGALALPTGRRRMHQQHQKLESSQCIVQCSRRRLSLLSTRCAIQTSTRRLENHLESRHKESLAEHTTCKSGVRSRGKPGPGLAFDRRVVCLVLVGVAGFGMTCASSIACTMPHEHNECMAPFSTHPTREVSDHA